MDPCFHQCPYNKVLGNLWLKKTTTTKTKQQQQQQQQQTPVVFRPLCNLTQQFTMALQNKLLCNFDPFNNDIIHGSTVAKQSFFMTYCRYTTHF